MSKIRNHANLRLPTGFDLSKDFTTKRGERDLHDIEESHEKPRKDSEDASSHPRIEDHDIRNDESHSSSPRKIFLSANDIDPRGIAEDLKSKLSLADRVIGKSHKNVENPETKDENTKPSKIIHIFRKKYTLGTSCENTREKKSNNKHVPCETDEYRPNKHMSYENPTFVLDSSLDSSVSSFFFENEQEEEERKEEEQRRDFKSEYSESHGDEALTVFVDSHKAATSQQYYPKGNYKGDKDEDKDYLENEKARNAFRPRCETDPSKCLCETINRNSRASVVTERTVESFAGFDHPEMKFYCKIHEIERRNVLNSLQDEKFLDNVKTCPSKSCKIRTVDNITNFWMNKRGSSFRNKMVAGRKRDTKEAKDHEQVGQERVLVSTSSGSSTLHQ